MPNEMKKNSIKVRIRYEKNGEQMFKTIIHHPVETGYRRDRKTGQPVPADYIEDFTVSIDGQPYFETVLGENVSQNPFLAFTFTKPVVAGQTVAIRWLDNHRHEIAYEFVTQPDSEGAFHFNGEKADSEVFQLMPQTGPVCPPNKNAITK